MKVMCDDDDHDEDDDDDDDESYLIPAWRQMTTLYILIYSIAVYTVHWRS